MVIEQKPIRLDQPIDKDAPPTIFTTPLTPEYSNAALNLQIDFHRQKQSTANQHILRHPYTLSVVIGGIAAFTYWRLGWIYERGGWALVKKNGEEFFSVIVFATMFTSTMFTLLTRPTNIIKKQADNLSESNESIFGFELQDLARINPQSKKLNKKSKDLLTKGENTSIVVYRDSPIAVISLLKIDALSNSEKLSVKITGVGIRKVYQKSGIIEDLFDWAQVRANELNTAKAPKILLLIEVLSSDKDLKRLLTERQFRFIESRPINESAVLKTYDIKSEIWGLGLNVHKLDEIKKKSGSTAVKK